MYESAKLSRRLPRGKARRAIDAIVACLEYELDPSDGVALEDARAALHDYDYQDGP